MRRLRYTENIERLLVIAALLGALILSIAYNVGPIFEGPDETQHYQTVRVIKYERTLPDPLVRYYRPLSTATNHHAPLYYILSSALLMLVDDSDYVDQGQDNLNPFFMHAMGIPGSDNKNSILHERATRFPGSLLGYVQGVHLVRLFSGILGVATVYAAYRIYRILWPHNPGARLLALGLTAFWPQFNYMGGVINNDNLLFLTGTLTLLLLLTILRDGPNPRNTFWLGIVLGAAVLTKVNALFLAIPVGVTLLLERRMWRYVPLIGGLVLLTGGWWYAHNWLERGDPINRVGLLANGGRPIRGNELALDVALQRVPFAYQTVWARFGSGNTVAVADWIYRLFDGLMIVGVAGTALRAVQAVQKRTSRDTRMALVVAAYGLTWVGVLLYISSTDWQGVLGRYLLPGLVTWVALIVGGLTALLPGRVHLPAALAAFPALGIIAALCAFGYFLPAFRPLPAPETVDHPVLFRYGDAAELTGISPAQATARPGDTITITLTWRALNPTAQPLWVGLASVGAAVVKRDSAPATGNLRSVDWQPGETWAERYIVFIPDDASRQTVYPLTVSLYDPLSGESLPVIDADGNPVTPLLGRIAIQGERGTLDAAYRFGEMIALAEPEISRTEAGYEVCLRWQAVGAIPADYQVFVHLLSPEHALIAQADHQPLAGGYPTGAWAQGEVIAECVRLEADSAEIDSAMVAVGLYTLSDGVRLPAVRLADNTTLPDGAVVLSLP